MYYSIIANKLGDSFNLNYPLLNFDESYVMLQELNRCDVDYILNEVLPNLKKIREGYLVQDPARQDEHLVDSYEFGYDATIIDFYKHKSIINYDFWKKQLEVSSDEIYSFMQEWAKCLKQWKDDQISMI